jgi:hypothetical protein
VLLVGGLGGEATAETYDPRTGAFTALPAPTSPRVGHSATRLRDGRVLLAGGWTGEGGARLASAELFDPADGRFRRTGSTTIPRAGATATLLRDGRVLLAGGEAEGGSLASAEVYDPRSGRWSRTGRMLAPRKAHTATLLPDGRVLVVGGSSGGRVLSSAEVYDPRTGRWSRTGRLTAVRHKHAAVRTAGGRVLVLGGSDARDWNGQYSSAELYDPRTGRFTRTGNMRERRFKLDGAAATLPGGRVLVAGGGKTAEVFDPRSRTFRTVAGPIGASLSFSTATLLGDGRVLVAGGYDGDIRPTSRTWIVRT